MLSTATPDGHRGISGYWCESTAYAHGQSRTFWLGGHVGTTPRLALRWLRTRLWDIATQLDPPAEEAVAAWLHHQHAQEAALATLVGGRMYDFTLLDDQARYVVSARPVTALRCRPCRPGQPQEPRSAPVAPSGTAAVPLSTAARHSPARLPPSGVR